MEAGELLRKMMKSHGRTRGCAKISPLDMAQWGMGDNGNQALRPESTVKGASRLLSDSRVPTFGNPLSRERGLFFYIEEYRK